MNGEDFYKSLAGEISDESKESDVDPEEIAKSLQDMDDLDADLFGNYKKKNLGKNKKKTSNVENKLDKNKTDIAAGKMPKKTNIDFGEFDEDDPLAGLLSDEDEQQITESNNKKNGKIDDTSSSDKEKKNISIDAEKNNNNKDAIADDIQPKSNVTAPPSQISRVKDIDFGNDKDVLGSLGLDDSPKNERKILSNLFNTDNNSSDKSVKNTTQKSRSSFMDSLLNKEAVTENSNKLSSDDLLFGSYQPSIASVSHGRRNEKRNLTNLNNSSKKQDSIDFGFLDKETADPKRKNDLNENNLKKLHNHNASSEDWLIDKSSAVSTNQKASESSEIKNSTNEDKTKSHRQAGFEDWLGINDKNSSYSLNVTSAKEHSNRKSRGVSWLESDDSAFHSQTSSTPVPTKHSVEETFNAVKTKPKESNDPTYGNESKLTKDKSIIFDNSSFVNSEEIQTTKTKSSMDKYLDDTSITISDNKTSGFDAELPESQSDFIPGIFKKTNPILASNTGNEKLNLSEQKKNKMAGTNDTSSELLQLQKKIELMEQERIQLMSYMHSLQTNNQEQIKVLIETHQSQLKHLEQENKHLEIKHAKEQETLQKEYEIKTDQWNKEYKETMIYCQKKLEDVQQLFSKEIADLKKTEITAFQELKSSFEESFDTFKKFITRNNEGNSQSGNSGLNSLMQNCLAMLKQQSDEFGNLKKQLDEEKRTTLKEREAKIHEQEMNLLKQSQSSEIQSNSIANQKLNEYERRVAEQASELAKEWEKLEISQQKFIQEQEIKKQELKKEIDEYLKLQFQKQQEFLYNWQVRLEENSATLEMREKQLRLQKTQKFTDENIRDSHSASSKENEKQEENLNWELKFRNETKRLDETKTNLIKERKSLEEEQKTLQNLAEQVKQRSVEAENMCMTASKIREEGLISLELAKKKEMEQESVLASIQKQLQILRNKEEFLNKEKFSLLNHIKAPYIYHICHKCKSTMVNKRSENIQEFLHRDLPQLDDNKLSIIFRNDFPSDLNWNNNSLMPANPTLPTLDSASSKEGKNLINSLDPSIISWQMQADQDRKILENEKLFLLSLSQLNS